MKLIISELFDEMKVEKAVEFEEQYLGANFVLFEFFS